MKQFLLSLSLILLGTSASAQTIYKRVTSEADLTTGSIYIIVCTEAGANEDEAVAMAPAASTKESVRHCVPVTSQGEFVEVSSSSKPTLLTLDGQAGQWTLKEESNKYLTWFSAAKFNNDNSKISAKECKWSINFSYNADYIAQGLHVIKNNEGNRFLIYSFNKGGQPCFGLYTGTAESMVNGGYQHASLYKQTALAGPLSGIYQVRSGSNYLCVNEAKQLTTTEDGTKWGTYFIVRATEVGHVLSAQGRTISVSPEGEITLIENEADATALTLANGTNGKTIQLPGGRFLGGDAQPAATATEWTFEVPEAIDLKLRTTEGSRFSYSTLYLGFPFRVESTAKAYTIQANYSGGLAIPFEVDGGNVPAGTAVLFIGTDSESHTTIMPASELLDAAPIQKGDLQGVYFPIVMGGSTFVFSQFDNVPGFYPLASGTQMAANRAFLTNSNPETSRGLTLGGADYTGISTLPSTGTPAPATYDLQGRRVSRPVHGLYIQGGRRILAK